MPRGAGGVRVRRPSVTTTPGRWASANSGRPSSKVAGGHGVVPVPGVAGRLRQHRPARHTGGGLR